MCHHISTGLYARDGLVLSVPLHDVAPQKLPLQQRFPKVIHFFLFMLYSNNLFLIFVLLFILLYF